MSFVFVTGSYAIATANEDASFVAPRASGVADGVGGCAAEGIDAGLYARALMKKASRCTSVDPLVVVGGVSART